LEENFSASAHFISSVRGLVILVVGGIASYFALAHISGAMTLAEMRAALKR
jgi:hypothetical protein